MLSLLREAASNLLLHRTRTFLATLGIIFGVASVICMLSISEVARRDVIRRIERLGRNNVIIDSVKPEKIRSREARGSNRASLARYGITTEEFDLLRASVGPASPNPVVSAMAPLQILSQEVRTGARAPDINVVATTPQYQKVVEHPVKHGRFVTAVDGATSASVCVLGSQAARELFPLTPALDKVVQIGGVPFRIVGVMQALGQTGTTGVLANPDRAAWIPFETARARFGNRSRVGGNQVNQVEINRAMLRVDPTVPLASVAGVARSLLESRHQVEDYAIKIPSALIKEQQKAENIFRWVMASLAAIALLVGGVGIMNIMLANMAERRQEIGLRRALGATRGDIIRLFISESTVVCFLGSVLGVALGAGLAVLVGQLARWTVVFESTSFPIGIFAGVLTGLVFGTLPAIKAARLDPVIALRVE